MKQSSDWPAMGRKPLRLAVVLALGALVALTGPGSASAMKVVSEQTVTGFKFPESVACDPGEQALYVSEFGSELKPTQKDGKGRIAKLSLSGKVIEQTFLPAAGGVLNKPKGIWINGNRLWVTDIDSVWVFDLKTKKSRKVDLPGIQFANDPAVNGNTLYVTDNRGDALYSVEPADFLEMSGDPKVTVVWSGKSVNPNGVYPARDGSLLLVGFKSDKEARAIFSMAPGQAPKAISKAIGRLDGVYETQDGDLLVTDWDSGSLFSWNAKGGVQTLAKAFKGPADLCAYPNAKGLMVVVPDLVKSELRMVQLGK